MKHKKQTPCLAKSDMGFVFDVLIIMKDFACSFVKGFFDIVDKVHITG